MQEAAPVESLMYWKVIEEGDATGMKNCSTHPTKKISIAWTHVSSHSCTYVLERVRGIKMFFNVKMSSAKQMNVLLGKNCLVLDSKSKDELVGSRKLTTIKVMESI